MDTVHCVYNLGHDHVCQRCRAMNLTCVFDSEEETAALLSLDPERDPDQNPKRPSSAEALRRNFASGNNAPSDQIYHDLSARVVALEATVASLLVHRGLPAGSLTSSVGLGRRSSGSAAGTTGSMASTPAGTSAIGEYFESSHSPPQSRPLSAVNRSGWTESGIASRALRLEHSSLTLAYTPTESLTPDLSIDGTVSPELSAELFQM